MFFEKYEYDIASYADDNTPHACDSDLYIVLSYDLDHNILRFFDVLPNFSFTKS